MNKTLEKLEAICKPYDVEFQYDNSFGDWCIYFDAPPKKCWVSSTATTLYFEHENIRNVIGFIKSELAEGFFNADKKTLRETGQLDEDEE
jgi:hypothetical protein